MAVNAQGVDVTEELAERVRAFAAQQDKKVMKKLKLSADCIPQTRSLTFCVRWDATRHLLKSSRPRSTLIRTARASRLPSLMKPLALLLAKPPITESDLTAALGVFDKEAGIDIGGNARRLSNGDCMSLRSRRVPCHD